MILDIKTHLHYSMPQKTDVLLQIEAASQPDQQILSSNIDLSDTDHQARVPAEDDIGERLWLRVQNDFVCSYSAAVEIKRNTHDVAGLAFTPPHQLPGETVRYLMPSRFCPSADFLNFAAAEFGHLQGGARIAGIRDWVNQNIQYVPGSSHPGTTALETFVQQQGVCRDFAHLMITLARASSTPARMVSVYAPYVTPPDFHAVAEVFLDGAWHLVDATGMATADQIVRIGVGDDAATIAFMTNFGFAELIEQSVEVTERNQNSAAASA
ncbi:transglutaminase family protein [Hoeflea sp. CAU 1731]